MRAAGLAPATVKVRTGTVLLAYRLAGLQRVRDLDQDHVEAFLGRPCSRNTRRVYAQSLAQWAAWAGLQDVEVVVPRGQRGLPHPANRAGIDRALLAAAPPVDAWIACGRWAGLRAGEVSRLRGDDVDLGRGWLRIEGKGGQLGTVPLHPRLASILAPYAQAAGAGPLWDATPDTVSSRGGRVLRAHGAGARFHELRHYYGTEVYHQSKDVLRAQRALRHASPATTTIYAQLDDDDLTAAVFAVR